MKRVCRIKASSTCTCGIAWPTTEKCKLTGRSWASGLVTLTTIAALLEPSTRCLRRGSPPRHDRYCEKELVCHRLFLRNQHGWRLRRATSSQNFALVQRGACTYCQSRHIQVVLTSKDHRVVRTLHILVPRDKTLFQYQGVLPRQRIFADASTSASSDASTSTSSGTSTSRASIRFPCDFCGGPNRPGSTNWAKSFRSDCLRLRCGLSGRCRWARVKCRWWCFRRLVVGFSGRFRCRGLAFW